MTLEQLEQYRLDKLIEIKNCKNNNTSVWKGIALIIFVPILGIYLSRKHFGLKYKEKNNIEIQFKTKFINTILEGRFNDGQYFPKSGIPLEIVNNTGFFKTPSIYKSEDLIVANYEGIKFRIADIEMKKMDRRNDYTYRTYVKGRFIIIDFDRKFNEILKIVERTALSNSGNIGQGLNKVDMESEIFNDKFVIYSSNPQFAFYILTPQMQEKLLELERKFHGTISYAFNEGRFYIGINDGSEGLHANIKIPVTQQIKPITLQIDLSAIIINELKFATATKFKERIDGN